MVRMDRRRGSDCCDGACGRRICKAATAAIAVTAIATGLVRLALRERSPWKVRSVAFDAFIGIGLGVGLFILLTIVPVGN